MKWNRLAVRNYRGEEVPAVLWMWLLLWLPIGVLAWMPLSRGAQAVFAGSLLIIGAGVVDDLGRGTARGLRGHLRSLATGRPTTGIGKIVAALVASALVVWRGPPRPLPEALLAVVVIAGCANIWNGLDVVPGRALKAFLVVGYPLAFAFDWRLAPLLPTLLGPAVFAVWFDLRERAMLGDAGANLLGFAIGTALYAAMPGWGIGFAALLVILLNVVAETVTFSRIIEAIPPLRWFDRLGTLPEYKNFQRN